MSKYEDAAYVQDLEAKVEAFQAEVDKFRAESKQLRAEISRLQGIPAVRDGLTFDRRSGIYRDESGQEYCPTCLDKEKRNPMKGEDHGWRCTAGGHYFDNPDRPHPAFSRRGGGGTSWMAS